MSARKILFIVTRADTIGGVHRYIILFLRQLRDQGNQVSVICGFSQGSPFTQALEDDSIPFLAVDSLNNNSSLLGDFSAIKSILSYINCIDPDLVWSHSSKAGILSRLACAISKKPSLFTVHGWSFSVQSKFSFIYLSIEFLFSYLPSHLIVISKYDYSIARRLRFKLSRTKLIYNSTPRPLISESTVPFVKDDSRFTLLIVARLSPQKDHLTVLKALNILQNPNIYLNILGDGDLYDTLSSYIDKYNLSDQVSLLGHRDPTPYYQSADAFILSSNWEGFPLTSLEALSHSLPLIVSDVCGCSEVVVPGFNGFIFEKNNSLQLSRAIATLLSLDSDHYLKMCKYSRRVYEFAFDYSRFCSQTINYIDSLIPNV